MSVSTPCQRHRHQRRHHRVQLCRHGLDRAGVRQRHQPADHRPRRQRSSAPSAAAAPSRGAKRNHDCHWHRQRRRHHDAGARLRRVRRHVERPWHEIRGFAAVTIDATQWTFAGQHAGIAGSTLSRQRLTLATRSPDRFPGHHRTAASNSLVLTDRRNAHATRPSGAFVTGNIRITNAAAAAPI